MNNRVVWITGASRGIGRAAALCFAWHGYDVAVHYNKNEAAAHEVCEQVRKLGVNACEYRADVSDYKQVEQAYARICEQMGAPEILINNAGIAQQKLFTDITADEWARMIGVNLTGTFNCCRTATPEMIRRKRGSIVNISSMWGICGASCEVHYSAAKAGVIGLTKALAKELGPSGIRVNCVAPGVINTDMNSALSENDLAELADQTPLCRIGTAEETAEAVFFLAEGEGARFITGQVLSVDGGIII